ncbi:MAG: hypothetical protein HKN24_07795 [Acidimicrobiales bacterium]|nr:hypothetical protein [Acidimicrobiales bacterium]
MRSKWTPPIILAAAVGLLAAACSGQSSATGTGVASLQDEAGTPLGDAAAAETLEAAESELSPEDAALAFSACMRNEGVDFPDLAVDADGRLNLRSGFEGVDQQDEAVLTALETCRPLIEEAGFGGGQRASIGENVEIQDALVSFSACVRDAGYDVGDVQLGGPGGANQPPPEAAADPDAADDAAPRGQGERQGGFGNRNERFATQLGLDYEDPDVAAVVDECAIIIEEAFTAAGVGQGGRL